MSQKIKDMQSKRIAYQKEKTKVDCLSEGEDKGGNATNSHLSH